MDGFLNILKLPGMTSHDVVQQARRRFPRIKVGHGGTLDPAAAGVLPLMLGKATRLSSRVMVGTKQYRAEVVLGVTTDSDDLAGAVLKRSSPPVIQEAELERLLQTFQGELQQVPPMFSAIKHRGKKMYQYAREGKEVERKERTVTVHDICLVEFFPPDRLLFEVSCSRGTYIRTLCRDIGEALGCGASMSFLLRTKVGPFYLDEALSLEEIAPHPKAYLLPLDFLFQGEEKLVFPAADLQSLCRGQTLLFDEPGDFRPGVLPLPVDGKTLPVYTTEGEFVALARWEKISEGTGTRFALTPERVFKLL